MVRERWRLVFLALSAQAVTVKLRPKESRCVWTHVAAKGEKATVEVFVESGGALNARLEIVGPYAMDEEGTPFVDAEDVPTVHDATFSSAETVDGVFASPTIVEFDAEAPGAYKACVFNSVSRFEHKVVDIDFRTSGTGRDDDDLPVALDKKDSADVAALAKRLGALRKEVAKIKEKQARERRRLAHHRAINDAAHVSIVEGSILETVVYVFASLFQIVFVRRWFEGKGIATVFGSDNV